MVAMVGNEAMCPVNDWSTHGNLVHTAPGRMRQEPLPWPAPPAPPCLTLELSPVKELSPVCTPRQAWGLRGPTTQLQAGPRQGLAWALGLKGCLWVFGKSD